MPVTFSTFTIGVAAIIGMPLLAGFYSKDAILYLALEKNSAVFAILALTAVLTSFYMVRMWKLVFLGEPRSESSEHAHEGSFTLTFPLVVLATLSITGGYSFMFAKLGGRISLLVPEAEGTSHTIIFCVSAAVMTVGALSAFLFYKARSEDTLQQRAPGLFSLLLSKLWIDEAYLWYVEKVQQRFALLLNFFDQIFIGGLVIRGLSGVVGLVGIGTRALLVGRVQAYAFWFLLGVILLWSYAAGLF